LAAFSYGTVTSMNPASHELADGPFTVASQIPVGRARCSGSHHRASSW
jgi:hypothetical protein